jgi:hypothetical protein
VKGREKGTAINCTNQKDGKAIREKEGIQIKI